MRPFGRGFSFAFALAFALASTLPRARADCESGADNATQNKLKSIFTGNKTAEDYAVEQSQLIKSIDKWSKKQSRGQTARQARSDQISTEIRNNVAVDNAYKIKDSYSALFNPVQLAYVRANESLHKVEKIKKILNQLSTDPGSLSSESVKAMLGEIPGLPANLASGKVKRAESALNEASTNFQVVAEHHVTTIAKEIDDYRPAYATLKTIVKDEMAAPDLREKAEKALELLSAEKLILPAYQRTLSEALPDKAISYADLYELIGRFPKAEIERLTKIRNREIADFLLSISPTKSAFNALEKYGSKVSPESVIQLRALFKTIDQERMARLYYPDIGRIVVSSGDVQTKLKELIKASTNRANENELLVTFARRIDLQTEWKLLKDASVGGPFQSIMEIAEKKAVRLGLNLTGDFGRRTSRVVFRAVDLVVFGGVGTLVYKKFFGNKSEEKKTVKAAEELSAAMEGDSEGRKVLEKIRNQ